MKHFAESALLKCGCSQTDTKKGAKARIRFKWTPRAASLSPPPPHCRDESGLIHLGRHTEQKLSNISRNECLIAFYLSLRVCNCCLLKDSQLFRSRRQQKTNVDGIRRAKNASSRRLSESVKKSPTRPRAPQL